MNQGYYGRGEKRPRSRSRSPLKEQWQQSSWSDSSYGKTAPPPKDETEHKQQSQQSDNTKDELSALDLYNSDLNLIIDKSRFTAKPMSADGFAFMWAGARGTYGVLTGKVCFEVKVLQHIDVSHLPPEEINPHVVRVGWSIDNTSMQLGEEPHSYGYGGTGKMSTNCQFRDYGVPFMQGDTVTAYLNMDPKTVEISYAKNGRHLGNAYRIPKDQIGNRALFPHVLTKNCEFFVNFGQLPQPMFPLAHGYENYTFIRCAPADWLERGSLAPAKKEDCEMMMMCGLPGAGKTTWAMNYCSLHPEKKYNVLGTNSIIDKMKVMGLPRKRNYAGRWDVLIQKSTKCLNRLMEIGSKKLRNFILDQTNVYPSAQKRKMKPFENFQRKAIVLVPTDEEFMRRCHKRETEEGKDVPDSAVLEMKANFGLPTPGPLFDSVEYVELPKEEAEPLVKQYNEEGQRSAPPRKRFGSDNQNSGPNRGKWDGGRGRGRGNFRGSGGGGDRGGFRGSNMLTGGNAERGGYRSSPSGDRSNYMSSDSSSLGGDRGSFGRSDLYSSSPGSGSLGGGQNWNRSSNTFQSSSYGQSSPSAYSQGGTGGGMGNQNFRDSYNDRYSQSSQDQWKSPTGRGGYDQSDPSRYGGQQNYGQSDQSKYGKTDQSRYEQDQSRYGQQNMDSREQPRYGQQAPDNSRDTSYNQSYGRDQSGYGRDQQSSYGRDQSGYGKDQLGYGRDQSSFGREQSSFGRDQSSYGRDQSSFGRDQPSYGRDQSSSFGRDQSSFGRDSSSYGRDQSSYGRDQSSYGRDQTSYSQQESGFDKNYDQSRGQSSYGQQSSYSRSSYSQVNDQASAYGQQQYGQSDYTQPQQQYQQYGYQQQQQPQQQQPTQNQGYGGYGQYK